MFNSPHCVNLKPRFHLFCFKTSSYRRTPCVFILFTIYQRFFKFIREHFGGIAEFDQFTADKICPPNMTPNGAEGISRGRDYMRNIRASTGVCTLPRRTENSAILISWAVFRAPIRAPAKSAQSGHMSGVRRIEDGSCEQIPCVRGNPK
jgi:hypothetical protein